MDTGPRTIARQASRGLRWSLAGTTLLKLGSFAMGLALARLLSPADFGLFAVALAVTHFVMHVNDVGLIAAAVQWRGRFEEMAPTATTLAAGFSVLVYGGCWVAAPHIADLAGGEQATPVIRLLTVVILVDGLTAVRSAALMRRFEQNKLILANGAGFVVQAAVSIALALQGAGPFSFAGGQVAGAVVTGVLVLWLARVPLEVRVDRAVAGRLLRFGFPLAASLGAEAVLVNADYLIVGRLWGPVALGFYLLAFNVSSWVPSVVGSAVRYVSVAGFSRLADTEGGLVAGAQRTIPLLIGLVLPIAVVMGTLADPLVSFLYGESWLPAASVLRFLVVLTVVRMIASFVFDILTGAGSSRLAFLLTLGWTLPLVPALWIGTAVGGIQGTAVAHGCVAVVVALPLVCLALRRIGVPAAPICAAVVRPLLAAAVTAVGCLLVAYVIAGPAPLKLLGGGTAGLLVYLLCALPFARYRQLVRRARERIATNSADTPEV